MITTTLTIETKVKPVKRNMQTKIKILSQLHLYKIFVSSYKKKKLGGRTNLFAFVKRGWAQGNGINILRILFKQEEHGWYWLCREDM